MNIELSRFRVRKGKSEVVDKWMNFLNENMEEVLLNHIANLINDNSVIR